VAFAVTQSKYSCAKVFQVNHTEERDNKCGYLFVGMVICWDKPVGYLCKA
jgi:hypothetical protein